MPAPSARLRQLFFLGAAFVIAMISCGREVTAPQKQALRFARGLSFNARFPEALRQVSGGAASVVPFTKVRVVLHHSNGTVALDTLIDFPSGTDQLTVGLTVALLASAPAEGEPMDLDLAYLNAAGETVFRGGPVRILAVPSGAGQPTPVQVALTYAGPGANATAVRISPRTLSVASGDNFTFTAVAVDANGTTIPNTPIVWTTLDPALATLGSVIAGSGTAKAGRGTVQIVAQLLTGATDAATLTVLPKASTIAALSGSGQSGPGGVMLPQPVVVKVTATDALPMAGVPVAFAAANGGTVGAASVTTDANGLAQTTWTLGAVAGAQTLTAAAAGLAGSPVTFSATSTSGAATKLVFITQLTSGYPGVALAFVAVAAQDALGNPAKAFSGPVTIALGANPGAGTLSGTTSVNAVAGVASFAGLAISAVGSGYTLVASSPSLAPATTPAFNVVVPPAALLGLVSGSGQTGPAGGTLPLPVVVQVVDAAGRDMKAAGLAVTFSAAGGGGVSPTSVNTDTLGRASTFWTLGGATGSQAMTAASPGLAPITVRATATESNGLVRLWNGSVDSTWTNPDNWSPTGVPGALDSVIIAYAPVRPVITSPTSIKSLVTSGCNSSVRLMDTLTISGSLSDSTWYCDLASARMPSPRHEVGTQSDDNGTVVLTGNGVLGAYVTGNLLITGGTHTLVIPSDINGSMVINGNARLIANGSRLYVYGPLATSGSGTLQMNDANDYVYVNGPASFAGGSETGLLTAGVLTVYGDFTQAGSPTAFAPSGAHKTYVGAQFSTQNISFANPTTSFFQDLDVGNSATLALQTDVTVKGTLSNAGGVNDSFTSTGGYLMTVSGLSILSGASIYFTNVRLKYVDGVPGATTLDGVYFNSFGPGATFFEFNRTSGGPYNFSNLSFSGTLNASGRYIINTGTVPLTLTGPTPDSTSAFSICGCTTWFTPGAGGITWP